MSEIKLNEEISVDEIGYVTEIGNGYIIIEQTPAATCKSCSMHGFCGAGAEHPKNKIFTKEKFEIGEKIRVRLSPSKRIIDSLIIFILPIMMMIIFYALGKFAFHFNEDLSIISSIVGLIASAGVIKIIDVKIGDDFKLEILERLS
jgi:positive regulator of sigma E activity